MNYREACNIEDLRLIAQARLPRVAYDFLARGTEDEVTLRANRPDFERIGFVRGSDIVKAPALGADLVFVGRATLFGAAAGGEPGILRALELLRSEVERVMALLGCASIEQLGPEHLRFGGALAAVHAPNRDNEPILPAATLGA